MVPPLVPNFEGEKGTRLPKPHQKAKGVLGGRNMDARAAANKKP